MCDASLSGYPKEHEEVWPRVSFLLFSLHILVPGTLGLPNCCRMNQQMKQLIVLCSCKQLSPTALSCMEPSPDAHGLGLGTHVLPTLPSHVSIGCNACYLARVHSQRENLSLTGNSKKYLSTDLLDSLPFPPTQPGLICQCFRCMGVCSDPEREVGGRP